MNATALAAPPLLAVQPRRIAPDATEETEALNEFVASNADLFVRSDIRLCLHLATVIGLLGLGTWLIVTVPQIWLKVLLGPLNAFLWFALSNVTIHHHHTHHNAAKRPFFRRLLSLMHPLVVPTSLKNLRRFRRAHMNHHAAPLHDTDVDHLYGMQHYLRMSKNWRTRIVYFVELTFVGGHFPGPKDQTYINQVKVSDWNLKKYEQVKQIEVRKAKRDSLIAWSILLTAVFILPWLAWGWIYPLILVKNWSGFLGQFTHFDEELLQPHRSKNHRTRTARMPSWIDYLSAGAISGHFVHHLFPHLPYYNIERARRRILRQSRLARLVYD